MTAATSHSTATDAVPGSDPEPGPVADPDAASRPEAEPDPQVITKLGAADFRDRVISGYCRRAEPTTIVLRQLFPGDPADIGVIDEIEAVTGQVTIYPKHRRAWTATDRAALAGFFVHRWHDRRRAFGAPTTEGAAHA